MATASRDYQRVLSHLHQASQTVFAESPTISAYLASKVTANANEHDITLSDSTRRKNCACCGYALIPGWTVRVRVEGWAEEPKDVEVSVEGMRKGCRKRPRAARTIAKKRKLEGALGMPATTAARELSNLRAIEPRTIYTCLSCDQKTTYKLYPQPTTRPAQSATSTLLPTKSDSAATPSTLDMPVPGSGTSTSTSVSRKRAKARKSTLSEMLVKEKMRAAQGWDATGSSSGFGLSFMDLMKTS